MNILGKNYIFGKRSAQGDVLLRSYNAQSGEPLPFTFIQATEIEAREACDAAHHAFTLYREISHIKRADFLDAIADELDKLPAEFIDVVTQETALPEARIKGERTRTSHQMRLFAEVLRRGDFMAPRIDTALPDRTPLPRVDLRQMHIALGPVAIFGASNFPLAFSTAGGDTASALAAGCTVVMKAHTGHMVTAEWVADAIIRAAEKTDMPAGVFNMIYGERIGTELVNHPAIQGVGFTGSLRGGRALFDIAAARPQPIPVFAEMSSVNPMILLPQALKARGTTIAQEITSSVVAGCGQFCTNPGMILGIKSQEFTDFIQALAKNISQSPPQIMLNRGTLNNYKKGLTELNNHQGVSHLAGEITLDNHATPHLFSALPELIIQKDALLQEEVFGPVTVVIEVNNHQQLVDVLIRLQGQLTATLIAETEDLHNFADLVPLLEQKAGRLLINGYPTGVEVCDAMVHGGPYPATSDPRGTSVGTAAISRFLRPVCYQNYPQFLLPEALQDQNPLNLLRLIDGQFSRDSL